MLVQKSETKIENYLSTFPSFAYPKEEPRKGQPKAMLTVETKAKKLGKIASGIPFGQFRLSLRFFASSKTPTSLRHRARLSFRTALRRFQTLRLSSTCTAKMQPSDLAQTTLFERSEFSSFARAACRFVARADQTQVLVTFSKSNLINKVLCILKFETNQNLEVFM